MYFFAQYSEIIKKLKGQKAKLKGQRFLQTKNFQ